MAGFLTSQPVRDKRLSICEGCKFYVASTRSCGPLRIQGTQLTPEQIKEVDKSLTVSWKKSKYKLCGCKMPIKVALKFTECPIGYWRADTKLTKKERDEAMEWVTLIRMQNYLTEEQNKRLHQLATDISGTRHELSTCGDCVKTTLATVYETLKNE